MGKALAFWCLLTVLGCLVIHHVTRIEVRTAPSAAAQQWAFNVLEAARTGDPFPPAPAEVQRERCRGPVIVSLFARGRLLTQLVSVEPLVTAMPKLARELSTQWMWRTTGAFSQRRPSVVPVISVGLGEGPLLVSVPILSALGVVPMREGMHARWRDRDAWLPPAEMRALDLYDGAVPTPLPDLTFGTRVDAATDHLARALGTDTETLLDEGAVRRFVAATLTDAPEPDVHVTPQVLTQAARDGAEFLLRHQHRNGRYTYIYDARTGRERDAPYNLPRHAGTTYFLAQMAHLADMPEARQGALRALEWTQRHTLQPCGDGGAKCVQMDGRADVGSAALTAVAATELLKSGDVPWVREMLLGLTTFLRAMQRPDGELMHVWDVQAKRPVDVQLLYYSGEAAFALLNAHRVTGDARDLEAARKLMAHLTGAGWRFFGSRYYYGEEHWTCLAVGEAADRIAVDEGADFCTRWTSFNRAVQYTEGETPWPVAGAYGVGPLLLPRLTPVASRTEAAISVYEMLRARRQPVDALKRQIERSLGVLLRYRWAPGPSYLFMDPRGAFGGMGGSPVDLTARNDFVQHAASAMIRWATLLRTAVPAP